MDGSVFFAQLLSPLMLVGGIAMLVNHKKIPKMIDEITKSYALMFMGGLFGILVGTAIVLAHNAWEANWVVLITLIGWGFLLKGVFVMILPDYMMELAKSLKKYENLYVIGGCCWMLIGLFLGYFGFFA
ncbi:MAG: hypothetical protein ABII07_00805 [Patescibacteria group bacterium]|nr:hypothetical protein [Patescibacteria group bacterium]